MGTERTDAELHGAPRTGIGPKRARLSDHDMLSLGSRIWPKCIPGREVVDFDHTGPLVGRITDAKYELGLFATDHSDAIRAVQWAHYGYWKFVVPHTFAAALMSTTIDQLRSGDVEVPAPSMLFVVPNGMLGTFDRIWVERSTLDGCSIWSLELVSTGVTTSIFRNGADLVDMLAPLDSEPDWNHNGVDTIGARSLLLASRFVVGVLLTMQSAQNFKLRGPGAHSKPSTREPPKHRVAFVGRPVAIDARPAVHRFLTGESGNLPSVQSLVRGHWKRQVVGEGRSGRKVIWVEPYWRGPEDAPILARPYRVGPKDDATH